MLGISPVTLLRAASSASRVFPLTIASPVADWIGRFVSPFISGTRELERNLRIVGAPHPGTSARRGIGFYAKYWVDTLRLPTMGREELDRRFSYVGYDQIVDVQRQEHTPIMVLPHLGSWEWAAAWLGRIAGQKVTAVVERLDDDDVFQWFLETRSAYGVSVVPLGPTAMGELMTAAKDPTQIICLVADRDLSGNGVRVSFFGRTASLPAGPALLSLRSKNPLLPVAIYDDGATRRCQVLPPIWPERSGRLKEDIVRTTQTVALRLETLIAAAPEQWHVLAPIWTDAGA